MDGLVGSKALPKYFSQLKSTHDFIYSKFDNVFINLRSCSHDSGGMIRAATWLKSTVELVKSFVMQHPTGQSRHIVDVQPAKILMTPSSDAFFMRFRSFKITTPYKCGE